VIEAHLLETATGGGAATRRCLTMIESAMSHDGAAPEPLLVKKESPPWAEVTTGVEVRMLSTFSDGTGYAALFRFAPGTRLPRHHHLGRVHAYTLQGRWRYLEYEWTAEPGSYALETPGSIHTLEVAADAVEPAVVLFISEAGMVLVNDDGSPMLVWDARAMNEVYQSALAASGPAP
jgi:quercetin dioxygenase-like cupin family protein